MSDRATSAVIVGAGKVGRGFIAHLLTIAGARIAFVEWSPDLVAEMARRGSYHVFVASNPPREDVIQGYQIVEAGDEARIADLVARADLVFTAIGGERLASLGPLLAPGIARRVGENPAVLNLITCENWTHPGDVLRRSIEASLPPEARAYFEQLCGVAESTVYRGCIEPTAEQRALDPLAVQGTDYWQLQVDGDKLRQPFPELAGIVPMAGFQSALRAKALHLQRAQRDHLLSRCAAGLSHLARCRARCARAVRGARGAARIRHRAVPPARALSGKPGRTRPGIAGCLSGFAQSRHAGAPCPRSSAQAEPATTARSAGLPLSGGVRGAARPGPGHRRRAALRRADRPVRGSAAASPGRGRIWTRCSRTSVAWTRRPAGTADQVALPDVDRFIAGDQRAMTARDRRARPRSPRLPPGTLERAWP